MMSIRLRLTLLYSSILALTLIVFGFLLYFIQADTLLGEIRKEAETVADSLVRSTLWVYEHPERPLPPENGTPPENDTPPPLSGKDLAMAPGSSPQPPRQAIVRVLDPDGNLLSSPFDEENTANEALPLSSEGMARLKDHHTWWEISIVDGERLLILDAPVVSRGRMVSIVQVARSLTERDQSLRALASGLIFVSLVTILVAFGVGWFLSGFSLQPIHRLTQTAQTIGTQRDFSRRVEYTGPADEVGRLATTFNTMLARLQEAYQKVAHSLEMQRDFVADVSHELRTPLTTLRGNLDLLRRKPPIPAEEQADILNDMVEESDRLIRLVNDLLSLARADAGRSLAREAVSVQPVIEEACRNARQLEPERQVASVIECPELTFRGDRDAFKQVLLILLDNALKHSQGRIEVTAGREGQRVRVTVVDEGPGIPAEVLAHVFDRFYRAQNHPFTPGLGLGLPIAKTLMEAQGGSIEMVSDVARGSLFTLYLPALD